MIAAAQHFIYRGGRGHEVIPRDATHVSIDESITTIPAKAFYEHPNIVELICHVGVKRIEWAAFFSCPRLRRVVIPGVEVVGAEAFYYCRAVTYIECPKLERIESSAFHGPNSLSSINLLSAKVVEDAAFAYCKALTDVTFGKNLESIGKAAFCNCSSLERITIPLKNGLFTADNIFKRCSKLEEADLFEEEVLQDTIDALLLEGWRNDMDREVESINQILPDTPAGDFYFGYEDEVEDEEGRKNPVIREWIGRVLHKIADYKAQHRRILKEAASALQHALPNEIVMNNVLAFLELPSHTFEGEDQLEGNGSSDEANLLAEDVGGNEEEDNDEDDEVEEQNVGRRDAELGTKRRKIIL